MLIMTVMSQVGPVMFAHNDCYVSGWTCHIYSYIVCHVSGCRWSRIFTRSTSEVLSWLTSHPTVPSQVGTATGLTAQLGHRSSVVISLIESKTVNKQTANSPSCFFCNQSTFSRSSVKTRVSVPRFNSFIFCYFLVTTTDVLNEGLLPAKLCLLTL